jgi:hypothetical protein
MKLPRKTRLAIDSLAAIAGLEALRFGRASLGKAPC